MVLDLKRIPHLPVFPRGLVNRWGVDHSGKNVV